MPLNPGTVIGPYEVVAPLGAGGMGEVYRARDARIGRDVALKILPEAVAGDPERIARFQREAQVLGALNHQHIASIYGLEHDASGVGVALVMELVEGPTLADRIATGPLPLDEALAIARQIAEALDAAHEIGIVHRDLKPANVKVRPDGTVKVLDFGLAKFHAPPEAAAGADSTGFSGSGGLGVSRAVTTPAVTGAWTIVGTPAYMAPEQARGQNVDRRADVWAFGVVVYEMLTGATAFPGVDASDTLATVIKFDPDWTRLPAATPPSIRRLLKRCLAKDPRQRLRDCGSALLDIRDAQSGETSVTPGATGDATAARRSWLPLIAVATVAIAAGAAGWAWLAPLATTAPQPTRRFTITLPESDQLPTQSGALLALSPDGRTLVYRAARGNVRQLFRRAIDQFESTALPGTEDASFPMFSLDGAWLIFEAPVDGARPIKRMPATGGPAQTFATIPAATRGRTWMPDGRLVIALGSAGLMQIPGGGGPPTALFTPPERRFVSSPRVLNGRTVLFLMGDGAENASPPNLVAHRLDSSELKTIVADADAPRTLPTGHLVFVRDASLWAVPFDADRLEVQGTPVPVVEGIRVEPLGAVQYQVADDGTLVFIPAGSGGTDDRALQFIAPGGRTETVPAAPRRYSAVKLSPDGTRIAVQIDIEDDADVWVIEIARGALTRVTSEAGFDGFPIWTPDGRYVVFASRRDGQWTLNRRAADGTGAIESLARSPAPDQAFMPSTFTRTGELISTLGTDIGIASSDGTGEWKALIQSPMIESQGTLSPDGRWLAFTSNDSGRAQVYLQPYPAMNNRQVVSLDDGQWPAWSADSRMLFFLRGTPPRDLMSATIELTPNGVARIGRPVKAADWSFYGARGRGARYYDIAPDGRLLAISSRGESSTAGRQIHVVLNWFDELQRLVPVPPALRSKN